MTLRFKRNNEEKRTTGKLFSRAGKATGKYPNAWNVERETGIELIDLDRCVHMGRSC